MFIISQFLESEIPTELSWILSFKGLSPGCNQDVSQGWGLIGLFNWGRSCSQVHVVLGGIQFHVSCWTSGLTSLLAFHPQLLVIWTSAQSNWECGSLYHQSQQNRASASNMEVRILWDLVTGGTFHHLCHSLLKYVTDLPHSTGEDLHGVNSRRWRSFGNQHRVHLPHVF